jgi:pimeloyl-ACP methyl ester carboxylesterase
MADVVVLPGRMIGAGAPLLLYGAEVAARRGATVHRHEWAGEAPMPFDPAVEGWVADQAGPLLDGLAGRPLVIAKSLGTHAAPLVAGRGLPAVWLTPLLQAPWVAAALGRATAPSLLVGGGADSSWDGALARRLSPHVLEIPDADHGLSVPGPLTDTIAVLARVVEAIDAFLERIDWP